MNSSLKSSLALASVLLGVACGDEPLPNTELGLFPAPTDRAELEPQRLANATKDGVLVEFWRVWTIVDTYRHDENSGFDAFTPSVMIHQVGTVESLSDPVGSIRAYMRETPTSGELYHGLTGEDPPRGLLELQELEATRFDRPLDFIAVEPGEVPPRDVDKQNFQDPPAWTGVPQGHHFDRNFITQVPWVCSNPALPGCPQTQLPTNVTMFVCGDRTWADIRGSYVPAYGNCGGKTGGWMRVGVGNWGGLITTAMVSQTWFGPSTSGEWVSGPPYSLTPGMYVVTDWASSTYRQLAQTAARSRTADQQVRFFTTNIVPN